MPIKGENMVRIAINGFGRIGKTFLRTVFAQESTSKKINIIAINTGKIAYRGIAHNFTYDTLMGTFHGKVQESENNLIIQGHTIQLYSEPEPSKLPWGALGIDWVVDATGKFTHREEAQCHIDSGAHAVLITAPAHNEDIAIIPGINDELFDKKKHHIVSLGSCTTNAFIPLIKIINDTYGIQHAFMSTIHAYTNSQMLLDGLEADPRRSRAAALNIVPTTSGASDMLAKVLPDMKAHVAICALRVPIGKVSLIDLSCVTEKEVTVSKVHDALQKAAQGRMKGIVALTMEPLVSSDFNGNPLSVIVDGLLTIAHHKAIKLYGWYDNEWGYSMRMRDFLMQCSQNAE
jgi:glyceraldehyde 3-phosphate dehydrogenase